MKFYVEPIVEIEKFQGLDELMWNISDDDGPEIVDPFTAK